MLRLAAEFGGKRHAQAGRNPQSECARGRLHAGRFRGIGMALKVRSGTAKGVEIACREVTAIGQHSVEHGRAVALGQDEAVALRPLGIVRVVPHQVIVEGHDHVGGPEAAAHVPRVSPMNHRENAAADLQRLALQCPDGCFARHAQFLRSASIADRLRRPGVNYG